MTSSAIQHFQGFLALLQALAVEQIEFESLEHHEHAFGTFILVVSRGHKKVRFVWDGRESLLTVECQKFQNRSVTTKWEHGAFIAAISRQAALAEIESIAVTMFE